MVTGAAKTEFIDKEFNEDNFEAFAQQADPLLSDTQIDTAFDNLIADGINTFSGVFTALDADRNGFVDSEEIKAGCGVCQAGQSHGISADAASADGLTGQQLNEQMQEKTQTGTALTEDEKNTVISDYEEESSLLFGALSDSDIAYLQEVNLFTGMGEDGNPYTEEALEAYRLIVDMYANDSDFRDLLQYYIDSKGEGPIITMAELDSGSPNTSLFGIGSVGGTESVIDITNLTEDPERAQETMAHELMHNLGETHSTAAEEAKFDEELASMNDMEDGGGSTSYAWSDYAAQDPDGMPYEATP